MFLHVTKTQQQNQVPPAEPPPCIQTSSGGLVADF